MKIALLPDLKTLSWLSKIFFSLLLCIASTSLHAIDDPNYPFHPKVNIPFTSSNLPVVIINLDERMADKEADKRVSADMKIIWNKAGRSDLNDDANIDYEGKIGIKYRGNSSFWNADKKPFAVRIQDENGKKKKASILGMGEDDDWALLSSYSDKTLMRDVLLFELMRGALDYVPTGRYCEVVLNGVYQGVYIMTARVRQGSNRIDIEEPTADEGDGLTGGYHLEIDRNDDPGFYGPNYVRDLLEKIKPYRTYYQVKYPDMEDLSDAQIDYIKNRVTSMEQAVSGADFCDPESGFRAYLDTTSLMNFYFAQEIARNVDAYRLSTPLYKYPDSVDERFKFSIWDFNLGFANADYYDAWSAAGWAYNQNDFQDDKPVPWMFKRILQDGTFVNSLKELWAEQRQDRFSDKRTDFLIDSLKNELSEAQARNFQAWKILGVRVWPNYYISSKWDDEVAFLRQWAHQRFAWLDSQWIQESPNLVANGDMEAVPSTGLTGNVRMANWRVTGNVYFSDTNPNEGRYALSIHPSAKARQILTELTPGRYSLSAWVKTLNDQHGYIYIKYHKNRDGSDEVRIPVRKSERYGEHSQSDIEVTNNFAEIGFVAETYSGEGRIWIDDVVFKKQDNVVSNEKIRENEGVIVTVDRASQQVYIQIDPVKSKGKEDILVYDIWGNVKYQSTLQADYHTITNVFTPGRIYILRVGRYVEKIVM